jgi:hypothetical protein
MTPAGLPTARACRLKAARETCKIRVAALRSRR